MRRPLARAAAAGLLCLAAACHQVRPDRPAAPRTGAPEPPPALERQRDPSLEGSASFYGAGLAGHTTASGERFDPSALTAAHRTLPFGSLVRVTNLGNGRSVTVRINDRGPFAKHRLIDLSEAAARQLGLIDQGHAQVRLEILSSP